VLSKRAGQGVALGMGATARHQHHQHQPDRGHASTGQPREAALGPPSFPQHSASGHMLGPRARGEPAHAAPEGCPLTFLQQISGPGLMSWCQWMTARPPRRKHQEACGAIHVGREGAGQGSTSQRI
jgi:hypothetical protein